jgi:hypothetical protein
MKLKVYKTLTKNLMGVPEGEFSIRYDKGLFTLTLMLLDGNGVELILSTEQAKDVSSVINQLSPPLYSEIQEETNDDLTL